jgi:AcrR family transcriptional regulator
MALRINGLVRTAPTPRTRFARTIPARARDDRKVSPMATTPATRRRDPERTRTEILDVATQEFADRGFSGARVDEIAARTKTTKRMIYYYFESKEGLYTAVLERCYATIRLAENAVDVDALGPVAAIRRLAELTFDHDEAHPEFIRLVTVENIHRAEHMAHSRHFGELNHPVIRLIETILERGYADGSFRREVDPVDLHMLISSFCFFRVANQHTFKTIFARDPLDPATRERYRAMVGDTVVAFLTATG